MSSRKAEIALALSNIQDRIAAAVTAANRKLEDVQLIVVTKTFPIIDLEICYELGVRNFGENRDQEGSVKSQDLPSDIRWHFQGQVQSNKIKSIASWADVVHSIDNFSHAQKLSAAVKDFGGASKDIYIQLSLDSKVSAARGGVLPSDLAKLVGEISKLEALQVVGLMAVAPINESADTAFAKLADISSAIRREFPQVDQISAGMSNDFQAAISHGATQIRIGSQILGVR